jgi:hypothetical protein
MIGKYLKGTLEKREAMLGRGDHDKGYRHQTMTVVLQQISSHYSLDKMDIYAIATLAYKDNFEDIDFIKLVY